MSRFPSLWKSWFSNKRRVSRTPFSKRKKALEHSVPAPVEVLEERILLYVASGTIWPSTTITYSYSNLLDGNMGGNLTANQYRAAVEEAFELWASYAPLDFVEQLDSGPLPDGAYSAAGHPLIRLGHTYIDGTGDGNILAEGYDPGPSGLAGDIHFDNSNTWSFDESQGTDFLEVAVHEIGHALGLGHELTEEAIMNPTQEGEYEGLGSASLFDDDIAGIRHLYGTGVGSVTPYTGGITDDHGDDAGSATTISVDSTAIGNIEVGDDTDWFQFAAVSGTQYTFETHLGTLSDTTLRLLAQDGTTSLVFDDDGGEGTASKITWTASATGTFFLEAEAFSSSDTGTYTLTVMHNDDFGASGASATALPLNTPQSGMIGVAGDQDWFSIDVTAGQTYRVLLDAQGLPHGKLTLYTSDGSTAVLSGDGLGAGTDPWLIWEADTTGTMYVSASGNTSETGSYSISATAVQGLVATTPGSNMESRVRVANASNGTVLFSYVAYGSFMGGAHVALGDVNGDGIADVITGANAGAGPHVRVISGANGTELMSFFPYSMNFTGGVRVASADVNGDGKDDVITGAGPGGGPHVRVFAGNTGNELFNFFPYSTSFTGGVFIAAGDVNGDGKADVVTGPGAGGGPHLKVISGADGSTQLLDLFAYGMSFTGGIFVAAGDVNDDGKADLVTGPGAGGGPHVRIFDGTTEAELHSFFPYNMGFTGGVRVGASDVNDDGHADILTAPGSPGGPDVRVYSGDTYTQLIQMFPYVTSFTGGVFLDGSPASLPSGPSALVAASPSLPSSPARPSEGIVYSFDPELQRPDGELSEDGTAALGRPQGTTLLIPPDPFPDDEPSLAEATGENEKRETPEQADPNPIPVEALAEVFGDKLLQQLLM